MRCTVTGAAGFIGRRLVRKLLDQGHAVKALIHRDLPPGTLTDDVEVVSGDLTQVDSIPSDLFDCDMLYHLAGCTIGRTRNDFYEVNRDGTLTLAQRCAAKMTPPKFLYVSSLAAAGPSVHKTPLDESADAQPVSHYGKSKLAAEQGLQTLADKLPVHIVRPCSVFGDTDVYMLGLFKTASAGWVVVPGGQASLYSLIHVDDLVDAMIHISEHDRFAQPFSLGDDKPTSPTRTGLTFLCQGEAMSFPEVAAIVNETLGGKGVREFHVPWFVCRSIGAAGSLAARCFGVRPLINLDKIREGMAGSWMCDPTRLTHELNFEFQVSLEQRIAETAQSYREKAWL